MGAFKFARRLCATRLLLGRTRSGSSLVDVIAASLLTGMVLLPSMRIMRESIATNERLQIRQEMLTQCESVLEIAMQAASKKVTNDTKAGRFTFGESTLEYTVISTDNESMGGLPGEMTAVISVVWDDQIKNRRLDRNETHVSLYSKVAAR